MKWAPNPYVLAERLSGKLLAAGEAARADKLDDFLQEAFLSRGKKKTVTEAFAVFQQIAELFERPCKLWPRPCHRSTDISGSGLHHRTSHTGAA